jgi:hypothetical protein
MAAPTDQRIAVPIDDPNADTEWYSYLFPNLDLPNRTNHSSLGMTYYESTV